MSNQLIPDSRLEQALTWLAQNAERLAEAKADMERENERRKVVKAMLVTTKFSEHSNAAAENLAYADPEYRDQLDKCHAATKQYHLLNAQAEKEELVIQVWRSLNANLRRENVT